MIIGLCGFQGAGKDTVGDILVKNHGFVRISFGSALKDALGVIFGWNREMLDGLTPESREWREQIDEFWSNKLKIVDFTPRKALQMVGTDLFRKKFHSNLWVDIVENKINQMVKSDSNVKIVVTDCRFKNEMEVIKKYPGSFIFHIKRNVPEWFDDYRSGRPMDTRFIHPSEIEWMRWPFDNEIVNDKSLEDLELSVLRLISFDPSKLDFTCMISCEAGQILKKLLQENQDLESYYKIRIFVTKFSQVIAQLADSTISDYHLGYYKTLVYNDWTKDSKLEQFELKYRSYVCSMLNAAKNKRIQGRINYS